MAEAVKIQVSYPDLRWKLKQAAAARQVPLRDLTTSILASWLESNGFVISAEGRTPNDTPSDPRTEPADQPNALTVMASNRGGQ